MPFGRNSNFTGREVLLTSMLQHGALPETENHSAHQSLHIIPLALIGLGGIGKTQLAIEYAYRVREREPATHIFWVNATNEEMIQTSFLSLTDLIPGLQTHPHADPRTQVMACVRWLERNPRPWILIYDNVDDLSVLLAYLPHHGNGHILLTTRMRAVGSLATFFDVENLSVDEATRFLLQRTQRVADARSPEGEVARRLAITLAQFPLALDQAGAYVEETGCRFAAYLHLYQDYRSVLLARRGTQVTDYPDSVATT